jgi:hypothetical protein
MGGVSKSVIGNRIPWSLEEGAVKDLLVCHGNGNRQTPLPVDLQVFVIPYHVREVK